MIKFYFELNAFLFIVMLGIFYLSGNNGGFKNSLIMAIKGTVLCMFLIGCMWGFVAYLIA